MVHTHTTHGVAMKYKTHGRRLGEPPNRLSRNSSLRQYVKEKKMTDGYGNEEEMKIMMKRGSRNSCSRKGRLGVGGGTHEVPTGVTMNSLLIESCGMLKYHCF
jgi:hypothetical protein